ncbi:MAG: hypothetical protein AAGD10_18195 [Myxococcota bacterium]
MRGLVLLTFCAASISACQLRCENSFDCGEGSFCSSGRCETECFTDQDCREPPECRDNPTACRPKGLSCSGLGRCVGGIVTPNTGFTPGLEGEFMGIIDGFDALPGSGSAFIVDELQLAETGVGFDIDGECDELGCIDNEIGAIGQLSNRQIGQGIRAGESLLLIELAGLEDPYQGNERSMTVKVYGGSDADVPANPSNNFEPSVEGGDCCEFRVNPQSLVGTPPQAGARSPAQIVRGRLESLAPVPVQVVITLGTPPHPELRIARTRLKAVVPADLNRITQGLLGGAVPIRALAGIENPYCRAGDSAMCPSTAPEGSTLADLAAVFAGVRADIDLDGDGGECLYISPATGVVETCCNAVEGVCPFTGPQCASSVGVPTGLDSCAQNPEMADGYSVGIRFTGVAANIVGVAE